MAAKMFIKLFVLMTLAGCCCALNKYHLKHYNVPESSEEDNTVLRSYRRCMWEQSKFLPRRLVLLSLCTNLFCENNQMMPRTWSFFELAKKSRPNDCLDILPENCEQGDEEELMYKPFPECCPVYCNLKQRILRLKTMHYRHRMLLNLQQQSGTGIAPHLLSEYGYDNI